MSICRDLACCIAVMGVFTASALFAGEPIAVRSVYLRLSEDIDVPARVPGALAEISATQGQFVEQGARLARIEDSEARLLRDRMALEVKVAHREADKSIEIELARRSRAVAEAELLRAERSRAAVPGAVSQAEVDRLTLEVDKSSSEIERFEREAATAKLTAQLKESEHALASLRVERHRIDAPIAGRVVELYKDRGEWVEPGENVLRLIRLDILRAEGFVDSAALSSDPTGSAVTLAVDLPGRPHAEFDGRLTYVATEVEPTTGEVLVRAEIENPSLALRPGLAATMTIHPTQTAPVTETATQSPAAAQ